MLNINKIMKTGDEGIALIEHSESLHDGDLTKIGLQPKMCPAGYWTEGYGHAILDDKGQMIKGAANKELAYKFSKVKDEETAIKMLQQDLIVRESMINSLGLLLTQNQFDALISFVYNLGAGNLQASTLLRKLNNLDFLGAADEFPKWRKAGGRVLQGLVRRRLAERSLFLGSITSQ